jgi:hypothetical protein
VNIDKNNTQSCGSHYCDFYYKAETKEGFKYYGMKILTKDIHQIDEILDQISKTNGIFIKEKEFSENIKSPMKLNVMDFDTETEILATLVFEAINLNEVTDDNEVII